MRGTLRRGRQRLLQEFVGQDRPQCMRASATAGLRSAKAAACVACISGGELPAVALVERRGIAAALYGALACAYLFASPAAARVGPSTETLKSLSLEELMNVDVSTASRRSERAFETPAAVYVITRDEIRRSEVRSIPEALRLAPGVEVARVSSHTWAITLRGFNGNLSNKLLVLIDGRSVYSPLYAGVFWDVQDYPLEDVERIEVVGGPGGTLWGANAVNGVVNIITRSASTSAGAFFEAGGGDEERVFGTARFGGPISANGHARGYLKFSERDGTQPRTTEPSVDDWRTVQGGFRADWALTDDRFTVHGDAYEGKKGGLFSRDFTLGTLPSDTFAADSELRGGNVVARWSRDVQDGAEVAVQLYYDRTERAIPYTFTEKRDTFDLDYQQHAFLGQSHDLLWGAGARLTSDSIDNTIFATFEPPERSDWTFSAFLQDKIELWRERLFLTVGSKVEHNDYTGIEVQPNVRFTGLLSDTQTIWGAVSRVARIPSRFDADLQFTTPLDIPAVPVPIYTRVNGSDAFDSEELWAYEAGWRVSFGEALAVDLAAYYHEYEDLQTVEPLTPVVVTEPLPYILLPNVFTNGKDAQGHGATLEVTWQPVTSWQLQLHYAYFDLTVRSHADSLDPTARNVEGASPQHQTALHSYLELPGGLSLYGGLRYVDDLPTEGISDYFAFDVNST